MFMRKLRKDKRGLTLIELVCAMAILSIVTMTISGAMVFASNSYRQGTVDTALQQEVQFTANSIESLIIDATHTVEYSGGVLTITNTDYTYEIVYNATEKTLRYTQYETLNPSNVIASNELLAEHVVKFNVDTSNFAVSRNVVLEIALENGDSSFTTNYNITSRNDANAGAAPEIAASILCEDIIVLEPLQTYLMSVSVVGTTNTGYGVSVEGAESVDTTAVVAADGSGINVRLGATETGGDDGQFHLLIATDIVDSEGNPFTKRVTVQVRRVNAVSFSTVEVVSGTALTAGAVYRVTATAEGTNLDEVLGAKYDSDPQAYIQPNTITWSFEISDGSDYTDWVDVGALGLTDNTLEFTLKQDVVLGTTIEVMATGVHTKGVCRSGQWTNKASRAAGSTAVYGDAFNSFELRKSRTTGDFVFQRGDDFSIPIERDLDALIQEDWEKNHPGETFDASKNGYNAGYTGNHHIRYISDDGLNKSTNYSQWKKLSFQGSDVSKIEFKAADLADMKYMKSYTLELVYSFIYNNKNNQQCVYPAGFSATNPDVDAEYIYTWHIDPIGIVFGKCQVDSETPIDLESSGYLSEDGLSIGSLANPLPLTQSHSTQITYTNIGPGSNWKAGVNYLLSNVRLYQYDESKSTWVDKGTIQMTNAFNSDQYRQTGTLWFGTVNNFTKGCTYKLVLGGSYTDSDGNLQVGQIYTSETGWETYSQNNETGAPGQGLIYFTLQ